jgi:hypothetical protein
MPAQDSHTSGKLLTTLPDLKLWAANEEGYLVGSDMMAEELHQLALEYLAEKKFCPDSEFVHGMDCYYKRNHCHIENRNGARFIRPSNCSKFMLKTGAAIVAEQRKPGNPMQKWLPTYHGTDPSNVASILRHGLVPAGSAVGSGKTTKTAHGSALGTGVYTSAIPLYAQLYARPELWRGYYVQTFFMLCQHPDTIDKFGTSGKSTASIIGRDDVWKLYGGFVAEDEVQYRTSDPSQFTLCALMVKIHRQDPRSPGGEFHEVESLLQQIDTLNAGHGAAASVPKATTS